MATFEMDGLSDLQNFHEQLAELPPSVVKAMLEAGAEVVKKAHKAAAPKNTGKMAESITGNPVKQNYDGGYTDIYPKGTHHTSSRSRYRNTGGGSRATTTAEVGFIHEYGAPGRNIPASQWMRKANEECAEETAQAEQTQLDNYIESL